MSLKNFFPFDPSEPTLHQAQAIDPSARAQWPDLDWVQGDRIRAGHSKQPDLFMWSGHTPEGTWTLSPMPESSTYRIAFFSNLDDHQREESLRQSKQLEVHDPRRRLYALQLGMTELGYARSAEDAQALTNHLRRTSGGEDLQLALEQAQFEPTGSRGVGLHLERKVGRNALHLAINPSTVKLEFHRRGSYRWDNLCRFEIQTHTHDGRVLPNYWPSTIANPLVAATLAAILQADLFLAQHTVFRNKRSETWNR